VHQLEFGLYVGTKSLKNKDEATEEAEVYLAKIFDLLHGRMYNSQQTFADNIPRLSGIQITTTGFNQIQPLFEAGGQDERLIMALPEITLYETRYTVKLLAHTIATASPVRVEGVVIYPHEPAWDGMTRYQTGEQIQLTAIVMPMNAANKKVVWSSGDITIATVSSTGLLTKMKSDPAPVTITVTTDDGNYTDSVSVVQGVPM
jgi:hypothetical protein